MKNLILQFIALSLYVLLMGFTFCDGFKLHILRKLVWFSVFLIVAIPVYRITGEFSLERIIPIPTLLAFLLCWYEKAKRVRQ
jgi:hypothetical protein